MVIRTSALVMSLIRYHGNLSATTAVLLTCSSINLHLHGFFFFDTAKVHQTMDLKEPLLRNHWDLKEPYATFQNNGHKHAYPDTLCSLPKFVQDRYAQF